MYLKGQDRELNWFVAFERLYPDPLKPLLSHPQVIDPLCIISYLNRMNLLFYLYFLTRT